MITTQTTTRPLPQWLRDTLYPLPPLSLRSKPLSLWTNAERQMWEPSGMVWDRDGQRWV
jgi:hypothetical protein